ncbi:hypothetical protein CPB86DRAFT_727027 [Serendipita vermifera]|nr:hypothetical protein CPB86DRAFT_727027 [Serendipita vermifera]
MTCEKLHDSRFLSLFIMRIVCGFIVTALIIVLSVTHKDQPKTRSICLYIAMVWVLTSYSLYISYRVYECLKVDYGGPIVFPLTPESSYNLDVDWPQPQIAFENYQALRIFYIVWRAFQYANAYIVFGAAFFQIQQLATLYSPPLGASKPFKRLFDLAVVVVGLVGMALEWRFYGMEDPVKAKMRGDQMGGLNYAWHFISFLNLLGSALSVRGSKGQNKLAAVTVASVSICLAIYCSLGEGAHGPKESLMLLILREPALLISLLSLLIILRKTPILHPTDPNEAA